MSKEDETLTLDALVERAREHTRYLYDGVETPHRSCGISLAETFGRATPPYQSLRKGGITGCGECGAIKAGELILGEILGDPVRKELLLGILAHVLEGQHDDRGLAELRR